MEADSTTYENNTKTLIEDDYFPFSTSPGNIRLYQDFVINIEGKTHELHIVEKLQKFGLIPSSIKCISDKPDCNVICRNARVVDRIQWLCQTCGKRQPIREGSFFHRLQCTIQQAIQIILAWCEDADLNVAAEHFGVKLKVANQIYDRLDDLAVKEFNKQTLGADNCVVLAEMYPDCLTRLSPDTTDQPHVHRILMVADTNHIPTNYQLHVLKEDPKKSNLDPSVTNEQLKHQIEEILSHIVKPGCTIVTGNHMPAIDSAITLQQLAQHCDVDMQRFLSTRIWRQAITLCAASRDICAHAAAAPTPALCANMVQRYLHASLYRFQYGDGFYEHMLRRIVDEYTIKHE